MGQDGRERVGEGERSQRKEATSPADLRLSRSAARIYPGAAGRGSIASRVGCRGAGSLRDRRGAARYPGTEQVKQSPRRLPSSKDNPQTPPRRVRRQSNNSAGRTVTENVDLTFPAPVAQGICPVSLQLTSSAGQRHVDSDDRYRRVSGVLTKLHSRRYSRMKRTVEQCSRQSRTTSVTGKGEAWKEDAQHSPSACLLLSSPGHVETMHADRGVQG